MMILSLRCSLVARRMGSGLLSTSLLPRLLSRRWRLWLPSSPPELEYPPPERRLFDPAEERGGVFGNVDTGKAR